MIRKVVFGIIWWCMALNLGYLFIASIFSTSCLGSVENMSAADAGTLLVNSEHTFYIRDHWWGHLIVFVVFTAIVSLYHKAFGITGREKKHNRDTKQSALVLSIAFVLMLLIITLCDFYPKTEYCSLIWSFVYGFALYYWLSEIKTKKWGRNILPLNLLGGFAFHLFWKAQYMHAMPNIIMLLSMSGKRMQRYSPNWYNGELIYKLE